MSSVGFISIFIGSFRIKVKFEKNQVMSKFSLDIHHIMSNHSQFQPNLKQQHWVP